MCTLVILFRPEHEWPVCVGANRDEMLARPWLPPATHWPTQQDVVGGLDRLAGGTWLAVRSNRLLAAVLNRTGSLGPAADKRSRGELPLLALQHSDADTAADSMAALDAGEWRPFNLVIADRHGVWFVRGLGSGRPEARRLAAGLTMLTSGEPNDPADRRIARHLPRFAAAAMPEPPDWRDWPVLLADEAGALRERLHIPDTAGFGTSSTSLVALGPQMNFRFA